jgi:hypothetical protein
MCSISRTIGSEMVADKVSNTSGFEGSGGLKVLELEEDSASTV